MKRIEPLVERMLREQPELRNSDKKLLLAVWESEGLHFSETQKRMFLDKCSIAESLTRARRNLRSKYPGNEEVEDKRYEMFLDMRDEYRGKDQLNFFRH